MHMDECVPFSFHNRYVVRQWEELQSISWQWTALGLHGQIACWQSQGQQHSSIFFEIQAIINGCNEFKQSTSGIKFISVIMFEGLEGFTSMRIPLLLWYVILFAFSAISLSWYISPVSMRKFFQLLRVAHIKICEAQNQAFRYSSFGKS